MPIHVWGTNIQTASRCSERHPGLCARATRSCDNDPYGGNSARGRPHDPGAGVPRGRALLHGRREGPPGGRGQQPADHLHGARGHGRLSGRGADLPLRPGADATIAGHRRHHPHVPSAASGCPSSGSATTSPPSGRRAIGERAAQGVHRQVRRPRRCAHFIGGVARLFRAALPARRSGRCPAGELEGARRPRPGRALGAGRHPGQGAASTSTRLRPASGDGGPARQPRIAWTRA